MDLNYVTQQVTTLHPNYFYQLDRAVFIVSGAVASNGTTIWVK